MDFTVVRDKWVRLSVVAPKTAAGGLKLALRGLNALGEQRELLASVDRLHGAIWLSKAHTQLLWRQISLHPAELESVRSEVRRLKASLEAINRQLSASQAVFTVVESSRDQSRAFFDAEAQKLQNLEAILDEVQSRLDDHSSLLRFSQKILCYDVNRVLHEYLRPLFDVVPKRTAAFRSVPSSPVETHGKTLRQRASSIISSLDEELSSSAAVSHSVSTTSIPVQTEQDGSGGPSSA